MVGYQIQTQKLILTLEKKNNLKWPPEVKSKKKNAAMSDTRIDY